MNIVIKESRFSSPSDSSHIAKKYIRTDVLSDEDWMPALTGSNAFTVVRDGFTWIDITGVDINIWMREGETPIVIDVNEPGHPKTAYATGVSTSLANSSYPEPCFFGV